MDVSSQNVILRNKSHMYVHKYTVSRLVCDLFQWHEVMLGHCTAAGCNTASDEGYKLHEFPRDDLLYAKLVQAVSVIKVTEMVLQQVQCYCIAGKFQRLQFSRISRFFAFLENFILEDFCPKVIAKLTAKLCHVAFNT